MAGLKEKRADMPYCSAQEASGRVTTFSLFPIPVFHRASPHLNLLLGTRSKQEGDTAEATEEPKGKRNAPCCGLCLYGCQLCPKVPN